MDSVNAGRGGRALVSAWLCFAVIGLLGLGSPVGLAHDGNREKGSPSLPTDTISAAGRDAFEPQVASDEDGNSLAVWTRSDGANLRVEAALRGKGSNYGAPVQLSEAGQDGFEPQVAMNEDGDAVVVWTRSDGANFRIQATTLPDDAPGFTAVETLSEAGQGASQPQVSIDHRGNALATWSRSDGSNLRVQASYRPRTGSFGAATTLSEAGQDAFEPQVDFDHFRANALVVWTRSDGANTRIQSSFRSAGGDFEPVETVSAAGQDAFEPQVALDHKGSATVVWTRFDGLNLRVQSAFRSKWDGYLGVDTISEAGQNAFEPQVAVDQRGNATVVWTNGTIERIQSAFRPYFSSFEPTETISDTGASEPQVAVDHGGNAIVVWTRSDGTKLRVESSYRKKWRSFGPPETLSDAGQDAFEPQVTLDGDGGTIAVWTRFDGTNTRIQAGFRPRGFFFGGAQTVSPAGVPASEPQVAADEDGNAVAVWTAFIGGNLRVQGAFKPDDRNFGETETISPAGSDAFQPQVGIDRDGDAVVVYTRFDGANSIIQAVLRPEHDGFGPEQPLSAPGQDAFEPQVAVDGKGDAAAVWTRNDGSKLRVEGAFKSRWSDDFGSAEVLSEAGQDAFEPQVAIDESGNALAVWTRNDGTNERIQASYRLRSDEFGPAATISEAGQGASQPQVALDGKGNGLAVWTRSDGANLRVQAAFRPRSNGFQAAQTLSNAGFDGFEPQVAFDPERHALAIWTQSDGTNTLITSAFKSRWGAFRTPETVSEPGQDAFEPQLTIDQKGNAIAVWTRSDGSDLRVQSAFRPAWRDFRDPETISSEGQDAFEPQVTSDDEGNAIAVWTRFDGSVERVQADGRPRGGSFGAASPPNTP